MARYEVVKGELLPLQNIWLYKFTRDLVACVEFACSEVALEASAQPLAAYGTEGRIQKGSVTAGGSAATGFAQSVSASHANAYMRHFLAVKGMTARMDLGNLVEQRAFERLRTYKGWREGEHYLYNESNPAPTRFPINYRGRTKSARPDFRYEFYSSTIQQEVVLDITTGAQAGHLLNKKIGSTSIGNHSQIPIAIEIIWEDLDLYNANRCKCRPFFD